MMTRHRRAQDHALASRQPKSSRRDGQASKVIYENEYTAQVDIAADPVIPYMTCEELQRSITRKRMEMVEAAKRMEFIEAARLRDEVLKMEQLLKEKRKRDDRPCI